MRKLILFFIPLLMIACDSNDGNFSSSNAWYTDLTQVAKTSGFDRVNQAIKNYECIYTTGYSHNYDKYATRDVFFLDNGMWYSSSANYGTCRFMPEVGQQIFVVNIVNRDTMVYYYAWLYDPAKVPSSAQILGTVNAGSQIGKLVYYDDSPRTYTYTRVNGKLYVSNGDIFTKTSSGLIKDGSSGVMSKYDPSKSF